MDLRTSERINPNGEASSFDNDMWSGQILFMSRTSDADLKTEPEHTGGTAANDRCSNYLRPKQRRWELQFQVKFKKVPQSQLFFSAKVEDPIKLGVVQRAFIGATLKFVEKKQKHHGIFTYNVPGKEPKPEELEEGTFEKPHLTFAVEQAFDRITVTKEGEKPPELGTTIYEDPESMKRRHKGLMEYNTSDTFTFAIWSAYGDFTKWKCVNLPAIRPFSFASIIQDQTFAMHIYYLDSPDGESRHLECHQRNMLNYEFSHVKYSKVSQARKKWIETSAVRGSALDIQQSLSLQDQCISFDEVTTFDGVVADEEVDDISSDSDDSRSGDDDSGDENSSYGIDEETMALEELGEGMYLKSGDSIVLREANADVPNTALTNGGGFATLQVENAAPVVIEKVRPLRRQATRSIQKRETPQSTLIRNGDTVMIKLVDAYEPISYLSIHKGWWLKWVQRVPRTSGLFTIHTNDVEGNMGVETQSSYLRLGGTFQLRSKGSGLEVGVRVNTSAKFGGRVLGEYKI